MINQSDLKEYYSLLDLNEVKEEFFNSDLLNKNTKLSKSGILYGLELLPGTLNPKKFNWCPGMGKCFKQCLVGSGSSVYGAKGFKSLSYTIMKRARRSFLYSFDPDFFIQKLQIEVNEKLALHKIKAEKVAFRLNVFSDLDWTTFINENKNAQFYDYTKVWDRIPLNNYHLTFSASEKTNAFEILSKINNGYNVAIVFDVLGKRDLPKQWNNILVIDGDLSDERFLDLKGYIIGLRNKTVIGGKRKSSFVFHSSGTFKKGL